jgi:hypothetical protein
MKLFTINENSQIEILHYDNEDVDYDLADKLQDIAFESINISRNKNLVLYATKNGEPVGGVWADMYPDQDWDGDDEMWVYDFDVVVSHMARDSLVGPKLIKAAIEDYQENKSMVPGDLYIKAQVINPKLAKFLEKHYGFKPLANSWSSQTPYMTYGL